jgi:hypothetical protein
MEAQPDIPVGTVVQIGPESPAFRYGFLVVTATKPWGVEGYLQPLGKNGEDPAGQECYRAKWREIELVGVATWIASPSWMVPDGDNDPLGDASAGGSQEAMKGGAI